MSDAKQSPQVESGCDSNRVTARAADKVKTDRRDAYSLAKLLLVGAVPAAYIYPVETRPVRDLLRRRLRLVQVRAGEYGSLRRLLLRQGILSSKQQEIKTATETELEQWFTHPLVHLHASQELQRIELYSQQIAELEKKHLAMAEATAKRLPIQTDVSGSELRR